jgi:DNA-directed RNA polymerase specialized sigma24 family protein
MYNKNHPAFVTFSKLRQLLVMSEKLERMNALQSFHQLYTDYRKDVFHFLLQLSGYEKEVAEELTQETFYQAIRS